METSEQSPLEQGLETGYIGQVAEDPPDEGYAVDADHAATVEAERAAIIAQRQGWVDASREA